MPESDIVALGLTVFSIAYMPLILAGTKGCDATAA